MRIKLPPELEKYVHSKVAAGEFESPSEVVAHALAVLKRAEAMLPSAEDDLRREIDLGLKDLEEGRVAAWDAEEMKERIRRRMKAKKAS